MVLLVVWMIERRLVNSLWIVGLEKNDMLPFGFHSHVAGRVLAASGGQLGLRGDIREDEAIVQAHLQFDDDFPRLAVFLATVHKVIEGTLNLGIDDVLRYAAILLTNRLTAERQRLREIVLFGHLVTPEV